MRQRSPRHIRAAVVTATITTLGVALGGCSTTPGTGSASSDAPVKAVVVAHAAGINGEAVEKLLKEFTAETGIKATGITESDTDYGAKMQLAAKSKKADFDVALGVGADIFGLTENSGIYGDIDTAKWNADDVSALREAKLIGKDYVVSQETAALLVSSKKAAKTPTSWQDFFDTAAFRGNRGLASGGLGVPINLEYASIAAGRTPQDLYPLDADAALAKVKSLGRRVVVWDNAPKAIQDVVNGDTTMTYAYAPAVLAALASKAPITASAPAGTAVTAQYGVTVKVGPNGPAAGTAFLDWWFKTANQVKYSAATNYGIVVPSKAILSRFSAEQSRYMPNAGENPDNYHVLNYAYYTKVGSDGQSNLARILNAWNQYRAS